jgi:hypothetical protein
LKTSNKIGAAFSTPVKSGLPSPEALPTQIPTTKSLLVPIDYESETKYRIFWSNFSFGINTSVFAKSNTILILILVAM